MKPHAKQLFWNALLLSAASLLVRTVGVSFQVYVSNRAGAEAMGLFSLLSGIYGFALTLATSGIHLGVTHLVVEAVGSNQAFRIRPIMRRATLYALGFGALSSLLLFSFAEPIGLYLLKDARTVTSLRLLGITLPIIALSSAWGGYFTAVRRPYKNAAVQVTEQALKIGATMYLLTFFTASDAESVCCALVIGGAAAELLSFIIEAALYFADRKKHFGVASVTDGQGILKKLLGITLPLALTTYVRSGLLSLQHILIPEGLRNSGSTHAAALIAYGSIQSMALPVILYPAALIASFSGLLIPELAEANVEKSEKHISYMIGRVWSLSMIFSIGVAGVLICFSGEIGNALYPGTEAGYYIRILAPLIPIMYVDTATDAMMKGLGEQVFSMRINIADALLSVALVWLFIPRYGIDGYIATIYFSETFNTVLSITHLLTVSRSPAHPIKWVYKPLLCIVGATSVIRLCGHILPLDFSSAPLSILLHCTLTVIIYLLLLRLTGAIDGEEASWIRGLFFKQEAPRHSVWKRRDADRKRNQNNFSG